MKYVDEFRDRDLARTLAARIARAADPERVYRFMEFCGGHTHAIARYGIVSLLPSNVRMVHGPGCPVCVLPVGRIDMALALAREHGAILCSYGDALRVPASKGVSLQKARAEGADVRMVYSAAEALAVARENPDREVVFFAIGFETTTPPTALVIKEAAAAGLNNFSVLCCHVLTPAAIGHILAAPNESGEDDAAGLIDGFIGPAHVSVVIGSAPYEPFARQFKKPVAIAGFEPLDVMQAIVLLIDQVNSGRAEVENEFTRAVTREGNRAAQTLTAEIFETRPSFSWRGLGEIAYSALKIRPRFSAFDAEERFSLPYRDVPDPKACLCGAILRGVREPRDCTLFGGACTPATPVGSCMVSSEGACAAYYTYGRHG